MADILVSYTSSDRDWAFWIGHELEALGHKARIHEREIAGGGDIPARMEERHHAADHVLCVVSKRYLKAAYSSWERRAAQWAAVTEPHRDSGSAGPPIRGIETGACAAPRRPAPRFRCHRGGCAIPRRGRKIRASGGRAGLRTGSGADHRVALYRVARFDGWRSGSRRQIGRRQLHARFLASLPGTKSRKRSLRTTRSRPPLVNRAAA